jgi:hypothetical protein
MPRHQKHGPTDVKVHSTHNQLSQHEPSYIEMHSTRSALKTWAIQRWNAQQPDFKTRATQRETAHAAASKPQAMQRNQHTLRPQNTSHTTWNTKRNSFKDTSQAKKSVLITVWLRYDFKTQATQRNRAQRMLRLNEHEPCNVKQHKLWLKEHGPRNLKKHTLRLQSTSHAIKNSTRCGSKNMSHAMKNSTRCGSKDTSHAM